MTNPIPVCVNEDARLAALLGTGILDTAPEATFDGITWLAKSILGTPMSSISLVDRNRQWFKSRQGFALTETPRSESFCTHAIIAEHPFVVLDAMKDSRFANLPIVAGPPHIRFYLGMPLVTKSRAVIGALCVHDTVPRETVHPDQLNAMAILAKLVVDQIEMRRIAETDGLTNLLTNVAFRRAGYAEAERASRYKREMCCIVLDVDRFKSINDTYGHAVGDYVLRNVCAVLRSEMRPFDIIGRLGGEEFAIILPDTNFSGATAAAERLRAAIAADPVSIAGADLAVTASFGVADCLSGQVDLGAALAQADSAMYQSKKAGRNRVTCFPGYTSVSAA